MTKAELQKDRDEWKQQAESLQDELDMLNEAYSYLERENADLVNNLSAYYISDVEDFIFQLKVENLYTPELERFMEDYMRWHNKLDLG